MHRNDNLLDCTPIKRHQSTTNWKMYMVGEGGGGLQLIKQIQLCHVVSQTIHVQQATAVM